jgi:hypothetical protein
MDGMKPPNLPEQPVGVIRAEQLVRLLKTCEGRDFPSRRDTAIILLLVQRRGTGLGTALGLAGGALSTAKHYYHEFPVRSTFMRGQPGEIGPGKYGWQFVIREGGGVIGPPVGAKLDPDIPVAPWLHRAHYQCWFIGGGNQAFYTSPRVNTSYMKVFENAARNLAQGGNLQVTTMRGGGRTSLEWSGYTPGGQSMRLGLPDVLDSSLPTLAPTLRAANTRVTPGTTIWVGE